MSQPLEALQAIEVRATMNIAESKHISVFQNLQHEILSEIFLIVAHSALLPLPNGVHRSSEFDTPGSLDVNDTIFLEPDAGQQPWTLMHICRHWRQVALDTPRLWSHIKFDLGFNKGYLYRKVTRQRQMKRFYLASEWLELSKQAPLTIFLRLNYAGFLPDLHPDLEETIERWEYLCILRGSCIKTRDMDSVQNLLSKAKNLKGLELRTSVYIKGAFHLDKHPALRHLYCSQPIILESSHDLESLSGDWTPKRLLNTMHSLPRLSTLDVSLSGDNLSSSVNSSARLTNPLRVLKLPYSSMRAINAFLPLLNSPPIHTLKLGMHSGRNEPIAVENRFDDEISEYTNSLSSPLSAFINRISHTLTTLELSALVNDTTMVPLLRMTSNLKHLSLTVSKITQRGMLGLEWNGPSSPCADLARLRISTSKSSRIFPDAIVRMLQSRLTHNPSLKIELYLVCDKVDLILLRNSEELTKMSKQPSLNLILAQTGAPGRLDFAQGSVLEMGTHVC